MSDHLNVKIHHFTDRFRVLNYTVPRPSRSTTFLSLFDKLKTSWMCVSIQSEEIFQASANAIEEISSVDSKSRRGRIAASHKIVVENGKVCFVSPDKQAPVDDPSKKSIPFWVDDITFHIGLFEAVRDHKLNVVRALLDGGADPNTHKPRGQLSCLWWASMTGDYNTVLALLDAGADTETEIYGSLPKDDEHDADHPPKKLFEGGSLTVYHPMKNCCGRPLTVCLNG